MPKGSGMFIMLLEKKGWSALGMGSAEGTEVKKATAAALQAGGHPERQPRCGTGAPGDLFGGPVAGLAFSSFHFCSRSPQHFCQDGRDCALCHFAATPGLGRELDAVLLDTGETFLGKDVAANGPKFGWVFY